jgi:hypothetical protein
VVDGRIGKRKVAVPPMNVAPDQSGWEIRRSAAVNPARRLLSHVRMYRASLEISGVYGAAIKVV